MSLYPRLPRGTASFTAQRYRSITCLPGKRRCHGRSTSIDGHISKVRHHAGAGLRFRRSVLAERRATLSPVPLTARRRCDVFSILKIHRPSGGLRRSIIPLRVRNVGPDPHHRNFAVPDSFSTQPKLRLRERNRERSAPQSRLLRKASGRKTTLEAISKTVSSSVSCI